MRRTLLAFFLIFCALFFSCNKNEAPIKNNTGFFEMYSTLDSTESKFLQFAAQNNGDPFLALQKTQTWILGQDGVEDAAVEDSVYLRIKMKSGLLTCLFIDNTNENDISLFRGGDNGKLSMFKNVGDGGDCSNKIDNKSVLIYAPAFTEFYGKGSNFLVNIGKIYTNSDEDFSVTILTDEQCTYEELSTFGDFGFVIIDTHGIPDGFLLGYDLTFNPLPETEEQLIEAISERAGADAYKMIISGDIMLIRSYRINQKISDWFLYPNKKTSLWVTSKYINTMEEWSSTMIFGNMCYSAANKVQKPELYSSPLIRTAFLNRKLISYYGYSKDDDYSKPVTDVLCKKMEDSISRAFIIDGDSTGIAHLKYNNTEFNDVGNDPLLKLKHYSSDDYCFGKCGVNLIDPRDGQEYNTVCIGEQEWMAENLNYESPDSHCYGDTAEYCATYGKLYSHNEVMNGEQPSNSNPSEVQGICPAGWHLPSVAEWEQLAEALGGVDVAGGELKEVSDWNYPNVGANNSTGFSAMPGGIRGGAGPEFPIFYSGLRDNAFFHTSTVQTITQTATSIVQLSASNSKVIFPSSASGLNWGWWSVRCVKDPSK
ncbi:MAG TPA: FISUMP domain-containing protein [Bacteroidales bacterium]